LAVARAIVRGKGELFEKRERLRVPERGGKKSEAGKARARRARSRAIFPRAVLGFSSVGWGPVHCLVGCRLVRENVQV